jgi:two-component system, NtrC family, response regulator HydG
MDNSLYKIAVEIMGEGLLVVNTAGVILSVNQAFEKMTGYSSAELVGKDCRILNCTGCKISGSGSGKSWCGLFEKGTVRDRKCVLQGKDGRSIHIIKHATVLRDESGSPTGAVEAMMDISEIVQKEEEIRSLRSSCDHPAGALGMVGTSRVMQNLFALINNVALSNAPVLIHGESGVGKEMVAHAIHEFGNRAKQSFIKVNCASLNENLLESELFGHVKGAFTGAARDRVGRFEAASGGSILLDEIGEASPAIQVKLLRVLESKVIERVGDHTPIPVDVRVIAATNRNLAELVEQKTFREDLFYRINVVPINVPPLRERKEDIPLLAQTFIDRVRSQNGKPIFALSNEALEGMYSYDWPGNVRELRNAIEYAFVLCNDPFIGLEYLPAHCSGRSAFSAPPHSPSYPQPSAPGGSKRNEAYEALIQALDEAGGNRSEAARMLGVSRVTVWKRMKKFGLLTDEK